MVDTTRVDEQVEDVADTPPEVPGDAHTEGVSPTGPQLEPRPTQGGGKSPNPFVVIGIALVVGIVIAKLIDWRGRARSR